MKQMQVIILNDEKLQLQNLLSLIKENNPSLRVSTYTGDDKSDVHILPAENDIKKYGMETVYKKRFSGKIGQRIFFIETSQIAFFQAENKIVHLVDKTGNRYLVDLTLEKIIKLLHPELFFRVNRSVIVNIDVIWQIKPFQHNRLKLSLKGFNESEEIIISRDRVEGFRLWADA